MARGGLTDDTRFGYDRSLAGLWVMQQYLVHDVAALNQVELLIGDQWGLCHIGPGTTLTNEEAAVLDGAALLTQADDLAALRQVYEAQRGLRVPNTFTSLSLTHEQREVRLGAG